MQRRLGLLLVLISTIGSAAFVLIDAEQARPAPAPKTLEVPRARPAERDDAQLQAPQHSPGEVIGVPMFA